MRRLILLTMIFLQACSAFSAASPTATTAPTGTFTPAPTFTVTVSPSPAPTGTPTLAPTSTLTPTPDEAQGFVVRFHPDGPLYVGDQVSFEIIPPEEADVNDRQVHVDVPGASVSQELSAGFGNFGIAGRRQATITWGWDTSSLQAGEYPVTFSIDPGGQQWTRTVSLAPADQAPPPEPDALWESLQIHCCTLYFISGTDAARDIETLADLADETAQSATQKLAVSFTENITVTLMPRVVGHGGFAGDQIYVTYSDANYIGSQLDLVLHHEMIHILDGKLGGDWKPSLLVEGLATYLSGGHFKPEPLMPRAAALLDLETDGKPWYIPLPELADNFYASQHEIGYLEGAALIQYMVNTYGWDRFNTFYRSMKAPSDDRQSTALDQALQANFGIALAQLDEDFRAALRAETITEADREDMRMTVIFYDTVRRYQSLLDPSAYFSTAWLPDANQMRQRGIVADLLRHPQNEINLQIEQLLLNGATGMETGDYASVQKDVDQVNNILDEVGK